MPSITISPINSSGSAGKQRPSANSCRASLTSPATDTIDLSGLIDRVVERQNGFARASGVGITVKRQNEPVVIAGDVGLASTLFLPYVETSGQMAVMSASWVFWPLDMDAAF